MLKIAQSSLLIKLESKENQQLKIIIMILNIPINSILKRKDKDIDLTLKLK